MLQSHTHLLMLLDLELRIIISSKLPLETYCIRISLINIIIWFLNIYHQLLNIHFVLILSMNKELLTWIFCLQVLVPFLAWLLLVERLNMFRVIHYHYISIVLYWPRGGIDGALQPLSVSPGLHIYLRLKGVLGLKGLIHEWRITLSTY